MGNTKNLGKGSATQESGSVHMVVSEASHGCEDGKHRRRRSRGRRRGTQFTNIDGHVVLPVVSFFFFFARRSVAADERDEARICLSHLCSMYYVRVRWGSAARCRPKATVGWR